MAKKEVTAAEVRTWAIENGYEVGVRGRIPAAVTEAFNKANRSKVFSGSPHKANA
jgi:hypothetical protein